jgi:hypothetical protein
MGTIIRFPKQRHDAEINYYGLELFVESCGRLMDTLGGRACEGCEARKVIGTPGVPAPLDCVHSGRAFKGGGSLCAP